MGQIYNSDSIAMSGGGSGGAGTVTSVDNIQPDEAGNVQLNADSYCGAWKSGTTYRLNNIVSETVNGIPGLFVCLVASSSAEPSSSDDWRRIAGTASDIDGVSPDSSGRLNYNRTINVSTDTVTPQFNGELSWTLNISASVTVDVSSFTNSLYNTNPAAVLRLVISASPELTVTFTNGNNYWLPDGSYSTDAPVLTLDESQPMTLVEVRNITNAAAPGVMVRQVYPVPASNNTGDVVVPAVEEPGSSGLFMHVNGSGKYYPGNTFAATALYYAGINDGGNLIQGSGGQPTGGTWELRGFLEDSVTAKHSASQFVRIDGTNLMPATVLLQATNGGERVRNCRYSAADSSSIDCEVLVNGTWHPFTASPADSTAWGPAIYAAAVAGQFGAVGSYSG